MPPNEGEYSVDPVTRKDLDEALEKTTKDIKEHILLLISPILAEQKDVQIILTGPTKVNGLVGRMKTMATNLKVIYGLLVFICAVITKKMFF